MGDILNCASCGAEIDATQKFCTKCGAKIERDAPSLPTHCPNPKCGQTLEGDETFCPACGTQIRPNNSVTHSEADVRSQDDAVQGWKLLFDAANDFLLENPEDTHALDAVLIREFARSELCWEALLQHKKPIYEMIEWGHELPWRLVERLFTEPSEKPLILAMPGAAMPEVGVPLYVGASLDTPEFQGILSEQFPGKTFNIPALERKRDRLAAVIYAHMNDFLDKMLNDAMDQCRGMLIDGKERREVENVSVEQWTQEAAIYHQYFQEGKVEEARKGFEKLRSLWPSSQYAHNLLHSIYLEQKNYEQALREVILAACLDREQHNRDASRERDIIYIEHEVNMLCSLGFTPFLPFALETFKKDFEGVLDHEDRGDGEKYFTIRVWVRVGDFVTNGLANIHLLANLGALHKSS